MPMPTSLTTRAPSPAHSFNEVTPYALLEAALALPFLRYIRDMCKNRSEHSLSWLFPRTLHDFPTTGRITRPSAGINSRVADPQARHY